MKNILLLFSLLLFKTGFSQVTNDGAAVVQTSSVVVHKDPRIDLLVKKKAAINRTTKKNAARTAPGYRLLVLNTNNRDEAIAAKTKVYTYFPELKAYLQYQQPYFKLKAGNFRTRDEAVKYKNTMTTMFPKGVFIINDIIEIKPEKTKEDGEEL